MHGEHSKTKVIIERAEAGVKAFWICDVIAAAVSEAAPYNTAIVETTASFAIKPESMETAACHVPNPRGIKMGAISIPMAAKILWLLSSIN